MLYIPFKTFSILYGEAVENGSLDLYISERGYQDWMDGLRFDQIGDILKCIFNFAHSDFRKIREKCGYSRVAFSRAFYIPERTLQDWESGTRKAPSYTILSFLYALFLEQINKKENDGWN